MRYFSAWAEVEVDCWQVVVLGEVEVACDVEVPVGFVAEVPVLVVLEVLFVHAELVLWRWNSKGRASLDFFCAPLNL